MLPSPIELEALFPCRVFSSGGEADAESVHELSPLRPREIPEGFERWAEKRQREYRAGRHHARSALRAAGLVQPEIPRGIDGLPLFPSGFSGSITHTGRTTTFAAAVVSGDNVPLGLDAEFFRPLGVGMVEIILSPSELEPLEQVCQKVFPGGTLEQLTLLCFSAKEAFYKCVYPTCRQRFGFHDVVVEFDSVPGSFVVTLQNNNLAEVPTQLSGRYWHSDALVTCGVAWPDRLKE